MKKISLPVTACKQYCLAAGAKQGIIAYTQNVTSNLKIELDKLKIKIYI